MEVLCLVGVTFGWEMAKIELKDGKLYFNDIEVKELTLENNVKIQFPIKDNTIVLKGQTINTIVNINNATFT